MSVTAEIWNRANTTRLAELLVDDENGEPRNVTELSVDLAHNENGAVTFTVAGDHPGAASIEPYNIVRALNENGWIVGQGYIQEYAQVLMDAEVGEGGENIEVTADGPLGLWDEAVVVHSPGAGTLPYSPVRLFDVGSVQLDRSGWGPIYNQSRAYHDAQRLPRPVGWSEPFSEWILPRPDAAYQPGGWYAHHLEIELEDDETIVIFYSFDNNGTLYWDGIPIAQAVTEIHIPIQERVWWNTYQCAVFAEAGTHHLVGLCKNWQAPINYSAGFIAAGWRMEAGELASLVFITGDVPEFYGDWSGYAAEGDPLPGFTPGEIVRILLEEAQDRGALTDWTLGFTDTLDSAGDAWPDTVSFAVDVGSTYREVLSQLAEIWVDVAVANTGSLELRMWNKDPGQGNSTPLVLPDNTSVRRRTKVVSI